MSTAVHYILNKLLNAEGREVTSHGMTSYIEIPQVIHGFLGPSCILNFNPKSAKLGGFFTSITLYSLLPGKRYLALCKYYTQLYLLIKQQGTENSHLRHDSS